MPERTMSYRLVLPPTWAMLPVGAESDAAIRVLVDKQFGIHPSDQVNASKRVVADSLRALIASARKAGGIDVIFPLAVPWQVPVSAGIVMSELWSPAPSSVAAGAVIDALKAARTGSVIAHTGAGDALREVHENSAPGLESLALVALRSVHYTWPVRGSTGGFLLGTLTVTGQRIPEFTPIVEALTDLFDVMMESVVWA